MGVINVNKVYITVGDIASKNQSGGYLSPDEFTNFCAITQKEIISDVFQFMDANRAATALIAPAIKSVDFVSITNRYVDTPTDYKQVISFYGKYFQGGEWHEKESEILNQTEIGDRLRNQIDSPTLDYPVVVEDYAGLKAYPPSLTSGSMTYLYDFPDPVYATTGEPPVYDPSGSVQFILDDVFFDTVVYKICLLFGVSIKDTNLQQATVRNVLKAM